MLEESEDDIHGGCLSLLATAGVMAVSTVPSSVSMPVVGLSHVHISDVVVNSPDGSHSAVASGEG